MVFLTFPQVSHACLDFLLRGISESSYKIESRISGSINQKIFKVQSKLPVSWPFSAGSRLYFAFKKLFNVFKMASKSVNFLK